MGQQHDSMNKKRSDAELLYELVHTGSVEAIRALRKKGVSLEWTDQEGKTPLILACMDLSLVHVAKGLIELGANVNAYRRGPDGGTPLHHAAKRGSKQIVELLLSHRATVLVRNDNHQTPLDVARYERRTNIVRAIENHICYFSGLMREFCGPWFLEAVSPWLASRYVWVVVVPYSESAVPLKLEIVIYPTQQGLNAGLLLEERTTNSSSSLYIVRAEESVTYIIGQLNLLQSSLTRTPDSLIPTHGPCPPCDAICLNKIKVNKGACPICMSKMDQVVRLHAV